MFWNGYRDKFGSQGNIDSDMARLQKNRIVVVGYRMDTRAVVKYLILQWRIRAMDIVDTFGAVVMGIYQGENIMVVVAVDRYWIQDNWCRY